MTILGLLRSPKYFLTKRRYREIAGRYTGEKPQKKRKQCIYRDRRERCSHGPRTMSSHQQWVKQSTILPWSLQKGAGTTHTSIAFPRPPGPRGDKCLLCKASVFVEIGYCVCRMYYCWLGRLIYIKMKSECRSQLSVVRFEGALSFLWAGKGRMLNFRAGSSII